ncbi:MAG: ATP-binding protein, partial [Bacillota bacterium]
AALIVILVVTLGVYNYLDSDRSLEWARGEELYPLNKVQQNWLEKKDKLVIGVADDSAPFLEFDQSRKPQGLLKDYMDRIEEGYGIRLQYLPVMEKDLEKFLMLNVIDAAITTQDTGQEQDVQCTMPIIKNKGALFVKRNVIDSAEGEGLRILLLDSSPAYPSLKKDFPKAEFISCISTEEIIIKAEKGEGNAMAGNEAALIRILGKEELDTSWKRASGYVYERNVCLAVKQENTTLYEILNNAVYHTDNKKIITELQAKWTGISYPLYVENKLEDLGVIIIIIFTAVLCVFFLFYQSNKSLYEELQQRMELLIESQNEMQTTFDGVSYYMAELNRDGIVLSINKALAQSLGMKRNKLIGRPFLSLLQIEENEKQKLSAIIHETYRDEKEKNDEILAGKKIFEVHTFLIKNNKEQIQKLLIMMVDVTEARNTERQLLQNNKMIAVGQLAAGVAHEIRNPLGLIRNYCYVLKEIDYRDYITRDDAIAVIEKSVDKSSRIIENLLNFSRLTTNRKENVNLQAHVSAILDLQRSLLTQRKIDLYYEYNGKSTALINVEAVEIVLVNLITNAADAITDNGKIKVFCSNDNQFVQLIVNDNGGGIPPEVMDEIYNPFFTTKKKREGNGLGLYIVYNEVQKMGGEIKAESKVGRGTTFYIKIPIEIGGDQNEQTGPKDISG